jgi:hypothetical protein
MNRDAREEVPETQWVPYDRILNIIEDLRERSKEEPRMEPGDENRGDRVPEARKWEYAPDYIYNVAGILGERGSGKTTLLYSVVDALMRKNQDVVLPPIQPERFGPDDTFLGWVLAGLDRFVQQVEEAISYYGESRSLTQEFDGLQRLVVGTHGGRKTFGEALVQSHPDRYEYGAEMARLNSDGFTLRRRMHDFLDHILNEAPRYFGRPIEPWNPPLIIVPVDDADMDIERVIPILQQLRLIVSHARVVALLAGDLRTFSTSIRIETLKMTSGIRNLELLDVPAESYRSFLHRHVDRQVTKYLPRNLRVELPPLTIHERLVFMPVDEFRKPIDDRQSLLDLLNMVELPAPRNTSASEAHVHSLGRYFDLSGAFTDGQRAQTKSPPQPSPYCHALSSSPRDLVQIHETLRFLLSKSPEPGDRIQTTKIIRRFWELLVDGVALDERPVVEKVVEWLPTHEGPEQAVTDFTGLQDYLQVGRSRTLVKGTDHSITFRRAERLFMLQSAGEEGASGTNLLSETAQAVVDFATEFASSSMALQVGTIGYLTRPGGVLWTVVELRWKSENTDNNYWLIPDWKNYLDYFLFMERWNKLVDLIRPLPDVWGGGGKGGDDLLEYMAVAHLETIVEIQEQRKIPPLPTDVGELEKDLDQWESTRDERIEAVKASCLELVETIVASDREEQRSNDFHYWITVLFPWMADRVCSTQWLHEHVFQTWEEVLGKVRNAQSAREEACRDLARRIRGKLGEPWIDSASDLLAKMGDKESATELRELSRRLARRDEEQRLYEMISELKNAGVPEEPLDMLARVGPLPAVVRQLQEAQVSDAYLQTLLQLAESAQARADDTATSLSSSKMTETLTGREQI